MLDVDVLCMILPQLFLTLSIMFQVFSLIMRKLMLSQFRKKTDNGQPDIEAVQTFVKNHNATLRGKTVGCRSYS